MIRAAAGAALAVAALAVAWVLLSGGGYTLHARFADAGQLVPGGRVTIAGRKVGSIAAIRPTPDGQADVRMRLDVPVREGTRATIRAVGQAGLSNRYVEISPGPPDARELPDGAVLTTAQTQGIVNLDALLDSFGPAQRNNFKQLIAHSADVYAGSGASTVRSLLGKAPPAFAQLDGLYGELADDSVALRDVLRSAAVAAGTLSSRRDDLESAVRQSALAFGALASRRAALADALDRAPAVLRQAENTLGAARSAVTALRPALRAVPAAAAPLGSVLDDLHRFLPRARPVVRALVAQLPALQAGLNGFVALRAPAVRALASLGTSTRSARPILRVLRYYGADLVIGALTSIGGLATGPYDANGHYAKVNFVESLQTLPSGALADALSARPLAPGLLDTRTGLERRCPGGNTAPAPDGSSPWLIGKRYCDPADDTPASVNQP